MSFLLDPPALVMIGLLISRYVEEPERRTRLAAGVVGVFVAGSSLLYLDVFPWWFGRWMSGTDWVLNSGLGTGLTRSAGTDVLAVVIFASYPLWMRLGLDIGLR